MAHHLDQGDERAWTLLRTCLSALVTAKEEPEEGHMAWAQECFDLPRLWSWNAKYFFRGHSSLLAVKPDCGKEDFVFFFSEVWTRMFPKKQPDIPYFEEVRAAYIQAVSRLSKLYFKEASQDSTSHDSTKDLDAENRPMKRLRAESQQKENPTPIFASKVIL